MGSNKPEDFAPGFLESWRLFKAKSRSTRTGCSSKVRLDLLTSLRRLTSVTRLPDSDSGPDISSRRQQFRSLIQSNSVLVDSSFAISPHNRPCQQRVTGMFGHQPAYCRTRSGSANVHRSLADSPNDECEKDCAAIAGDRRVELCRISISQR